jgi:glycosyltransferase involved in cell wall biosynthesis
LPLAALEAQACGVPVVGFDVGGVGEAVCPASGCLVPAGDTRALSAALASSLRTPVAVSPRDFIRNHFSFDQTVRAYAELTRI